MAFVSNFMVTALLMQMNRPSPSLSCVWDFPRVLGGNGIIRVLADRRIGQMVVLKANFSQVCLNPVAM